MVKFPVESAWKFPTSYVAYDLETTGLHDPIWPVQYGAIRVIDGKPEEKFSTLVALPDGVEIEKGAIAVHGINPDMFIDAPSQREAYLAFSNFVGELPLLGFNSKAYDGPIIDRLADLYRMPHLTNNSGGSIKGQIDAMELYQKLFGNRKSKLSDVCEHYSVTNDHAHDAIGDVDATVRVYSKIIDDIRMNSTDPKDISVEQESNELAGMLVCVTGGKLSDKRAYEKLVMSMGGMVYGNVTKKVNLCILLNNDETTKSKKAIKYGIPVLSGRNFLTKYGRTVADIDSAQDDNPLGDRWESEMGEEERKRFRKALDLPVTKSLVWAHIESVQRISRNKYGFICELKQNKYMTEAVQDVRVHKYYAEDEAVTLDIRMGDGSIRPLPVNAALFSTMQSEGKFMSAIGGSDE